MVIDTYYTYTQVLETNLSIYVFNDRGTNFTFVDKVQLNGIKEENYYGVWSHVKLLCSPELTVFGLNYTNETYNQTYQDYNYSNNSYYWATSQRVAAERNLLFKRVDYVQNQIIDLNFREPERFLMTVNNSYSYWNPAARLVMDENFIVVRNDTFYSNWTSDKLVEQAYQIFDTEIVFMRERVLVDDFSNTSANNLSLIHI